MDCRLSGLRNECRGSDQLSGVTSQAAAPLQRTRSWQIGCCRSLIAVTVRQRGSLTELRIASHLERNGVAALSTSGI